jgi:hypothetical protein
MDETCMLTPQNPPGFAGKAQDRSNSRRNQFVIGEVDSAAESVFGSLKDQIADLKHEISALRIDKRPRFQPRAAAQRGDSHCLLCNMSNHTADRCFRYKMPPRNSSEPPCNACQGRHTEPCKQEYRKKDLK